MREMTKVVTDRKKVKIIRKLTKSYAQEVGISGPKVYYLVDNCIQNFHFGRYIIGYMVKKFF